MTDLDLDKLIDFIDMIMKRRLEALPEVGKIHMGPNEDDIDRIREHGVFPPDDPSSMPKLALLAIGETLGRVGGKELMDKVLSAYSRKHGSTMAARLSERWFSAAGVWY